MPFMATGCCCIRRELLAGRRGVWDNEGVITATSLDLEAIARACGAHGVSRLRVFGSAVTDRFDPATSDVDFLVDFDPSREDRFSDYFGLRDDLVRAVGREVDLVVASAVRNPYFAKHAFGEAVDVYAA